MPGAGKGSANLQDHIPIESPRSPVGRKTGNLPSDVRDGARQPIDLVVGRMMTIAPDIGHVLPAQQIIVR